MQKAQQIRYFLFSQYLADGIRITLEIIIPALVFAYFGDLKSGMTLSLGALCVSISDGPGPVKHKRNGMLYCNLCIFIMTLITGLANHNMIWLGVLILTATFLFSMIAIYGNRAASIGTASLLVMILRMSYVLPVQEILWDSVLVLAGGVWYMVAAMVFYRITPYRPAQRSLGYCIHETAVYLDIKSEMYNPKADLAGQYKKLLEQQVVVNEKQDTVRDLLFRQREMLKESTHTGRVLVLTFVDLVDLFEHIMATWYDYSMLREKYAQTEILEDVYRIIKKIAAEMNDIGEAIQSNSSYQKKSAILPDLDPLKQKIDALTDFGSTIMLKKILVNLRNLSEKVDAIEKYFDASSADDAPLRNRSEYARFVTHQKINWSVIKNNFTFESSVFRHSLRMMITCGVGFLISKLISQGHHSYWILMTIIIILKPGFSLTKQKNMDRLTGTIGGGFIGLLILAFVHNTYVLFALMVFFMLGSYTFKLLNYVVMVIFLTPYVLILFHFLGIGAANVAGERLADTAIASALSFLASYFLFPHWESDHLQGYMSDVLKANISYLKKLKEMFYGKRVSTFEYKLVRKDLFVSTANLSAALHRMLSEPKSKQLHRKEIYEFVVLNHVLSSNIASLSASLSLHANVYPKEVLRSVNRSLGILEESLQKLNKDYQPSEEKMIANPNKSLGEADMHLTGQLSFIQKVSDDIGKLTTVITR